MPEVTLAQILQSREDRVQRQEQLRREYHVPIISFTMNIAGPVKTSALIERGFREGLAGLEQALPDSSILHRETRVDVTGCQAMYAVSMDATKLKDICVEIEESSLLGRLFDLDVLSENGSKLSRKELRGCIVCGAPGRGCAAGRLHAISELQTATRRILAEYFAQTDQKRIASLAVNSLLEEVNTTPKPGLVDRRNNGSHRDMNIDTFAASAHSLFPYFRECVQIGQRTAHQLPEQTFPPLRRAGIAAEETMFRATGGINTHKGAIYSMGILCAALGRLWTPEKHPIPHTRLLSTCANIAGLSVTEDFSTAGDATAGLRLYRKLGLTGIRGEAALGFPSLLTIGLPVFLEAQKHGKSREEAGIITLLHLISRVQDTNLFHRGGPEGAAWAAESAQELLSCSLYPEESQITALDDAFIARNLSPGGCADLLALTFFLTQLENEGILTIGL